MLKDQVMQITAIAIRQYHAEGLPVIQRLDTSQYVWVSRADLLEGRDFHQRILPGMRRCFGQPLHSVTVVNLDGNALIRQYKHNITIVIAITITAFGTCVATIVHATAALLHPLENMTLLQMSHSGFHIGLVGHLPVGAVDVAQTQVAISTLGMPPAISTINILGIHPYQNVGGKEEILRVLVVAQHPLDAAGGGVLGRRERDGVERRTGLGHLVERPMLAGLAQDGIIPLPARHGHDR
mmetsp:Transcript_19129/g.55124  ORF Transcript_19129/g.55124 Transcript_19129/m.55124 type:complete len:239 (-) Transcript_19129:494-1210(-)